LLIIGVVLSLPASKYGNDIVVTAPAIVTPAFVVHVAEDPALPPLPLDFTTDRYLTGQDIYVIRYLSSGERS
jgi:hypothetical protein